jgi:hypothetical protein
MTFDLWSCDLQERIKFSLKVDFTLEKQFVIIDDISFTENVTLLIKTVLVCLFIQKRLNKFHR